MDFPKLKHTSLCRFLIYIIDIGIFIVPITIVSNLNFITEPIKIIIGICFGIGLVAYLIKNFDSLMTIEIALELLHCHNQARKYFVLPKFFSLENIETKISSFGIKCEPSTLSPPPSILQYKAKAPLTSDSRGNERIIAVYHTDYLNKNNYRLIVDSAKQNSNALKGLKKHPFLDKQQKAAGLNRATVIIIFAKQVEEKFKTDLFDVVCKNGDDQIDNALLPCVVDLEKQICTFDSMPMIKLGMLNPAKNSGIKIIKKYLFNNKFTFADSTAKLEPIEDLDPEQSLWKFWKATKMDYKLSKKNDHKRFSEMHHGEIFFEDDLIYVKWNERGVIASVTQDEEDKIAEIDISDLWDFPKVNKISKEDLKSIKGITDTYFAQLGYNTEYLSFED